MTYYPTAVEPTTPGQPLRWRAETVSGRATCGHLHHTKRAAEACAWRLNHAPTQQADR